MPYLPAYLTIPLLINLLINTYLQSTSFTYIRPTTINASPIPACPGPRRQRSRTPQHQSDWPGPGETFQ